MTDAFIYPPGVVTQSMLPLRNGSAAEVSALHDAFSHLGSACVAVAWTAAAVMALSESLRFGLRELRAGSLATLAVRQLDRFSRGHPQLVRPLLAAAPLCRTIYRAVMRVLSWAVVALVWLAFLAMEVGPAPPLRADGSAADGTITRDSSDPLRQTSSLCDHEDRARSSCTAPNSAAAGSPSSTTVHPGCAIRHLAVIMDGNRRYGRAQLGSPLLGHRIGGEVLRSFIRWCRELGVEMVTVYAFSTENWQRTQVEVETLMSLFSAFFEQILFDAVEIGIRVRFICSDPELLPAAIAALMRRVERETAHHRGIVVNVCVSYGSRNAVARAVRDAAASNKFPHNDADANRQNATEADGQLMYLLSRSLTELDAAAASRSTTTTSSRLVPLSDTVDPVAAADRQHITELWGRPDVLVRTSGEQRLSNFMLLELAYAELFFLPVTWPEVTREMLLDIVRTFTTQRDRRMGK